MPQAMRIFSFNTPSEQDRNPSTKNAIRTARVLDNSRKHLKVNRNHN